MIYLSTIIKYSKEFFSSSRIIHIFFQQMAKLSYKIQGALLLSCYSILTAQQLNQSDLDAIWKNSASHNWVMHFKMSLIHAWEPYSNRFEQKHTYWFIRPGGECINCEGQHVCGLCPWFYESYLINLLHFLGLCFKIDNILFVVY